MRSHGGFPPSVRGGAAPLVTSDNQFIANTIVYIIPII